MTVKDSVGHPTTIGIASDDVNVTVQNSSFTKNNIIDQRNIKGAYGSAIGVKSADLIITGSNFTENKASGSSQTQGSAVYQSDGNIEISKSTFTNNVGENTRATKDTGNSTGGAVSL